MISRSLARLAQQVGAATDEELVAVLARFGDQIEQVRGAITTQVRALGDGDDQLDAYLCDGLSELDRAQERLQQLRERANKRTGGGR